MVLCCECGTKIEPNSSNMCIQCLQKNVDITANIPKEAVLHFCRNCDRYLHPPGEWISASLESCELLTICLKRLKGLKNVELVDAGFIWTEPHSKRLKLKLTVDGEVAGDLVLRQTFIVEYIVQNRMCNDCHRIEAKDFWHCLVQLRQHAENKKTFYYLEQLISKQNVHENTLGIKPKHGGLNFYYANYNHARKMIEFLQANVPVKVTTSKRLMSHDVRNNNFNYRHTWSVEIAPLSKDSIVCLSKRMRHQLGNLSPICLVHRVASGIHLIDPTTAQVSELSGQLFFRTPFESICNPKQLIEYVVMEIESIGSSSDRKYPGKGRISDKHAPCDVWVVRASELGITDCKTHTRTHIGHLLEVGDSVMCYCLREANINDAEYEKLSPDQIPDLVIVRKHRPDQKKHCKTRASKLKRLAEDVTDEDHKYDYQEFLQDIEYDADYLKLMNLLPDDNISDDNTLHSEVLVDLELKQSLFGNEINQVNKPKQNS